MGNENQELTSESIESPRPAQTHGALITGIVERAGKARGCLAKILHVPATWPEIITAVRLLADTRASAWQPIESAPKDGSWILGVTLAQRQVVVRWGGGAWEDDNRLYRDPRLWQPLPSAPKDNGE